MLFYYIKQDNIINLFPLPWHDLPYIKREKICLQCRKFIIILILVFILIF